jgi:DNA polymerase I-like protein with 3'-5' exonuclease and polymerase domains
MNLKAILGLGGIPLRQFFPGSSITRVRGLKFPVFVSDRPVWYYPVLHPSYVLRTHREGFESPAEAIFRIDLTHFFEDASNWPRPEIVRLQPENVVVANTPEVARALINKMTSPIAVDLETSELRPYQRGAELLSAAFSDGKTTVAFSINHPRGPTMWGLKLLLETVGRHRWLAHNCAFELSWLLHYAKGKSVQSFDDSMAVARLAYERETVLDLASMSQIELGVNVKDLVKVDTTQILRQDLNTLLQYNGLDALACRLCWDRRIEDVDASDYQRLLGSIAATTRMELNGLPISVKRAEELKAHWLAKQRATRDSASRLPDVQKYEQDRAVEFKITSPVDIGRVLTEYSGLDLPKTPGRQIATDEITLAKHAKNPLANYVLADREASKIISTYLDPTLQASSLYPDGNLHPQYTTMFVATQRLSSRQPNIQNYPSRKHAEIRKQFVAPPGCVFAKFDYGQLEARVLAMASQDPVLCESIIDKFDIHSHWLGRLLEYYPGYLDRIAAQTGTTDEKKLRKRGRDIIKSDLVFNSLYGGGATAISERTQIPKTIIDKVLEEFWATYAGVREWHRMRRKEYRYFGTIRTLTGRVWRGLADGNAPINYPIQGTAADLVIDAMNELSELSVEADDSYLHPRLQIHDDISLFFPVDSVDQYIELVHPILTKVRYDWQCVPLTVEAKIGETDWYEFRDAGVYEGGYNE